MEKLFCSCICSCRKLLQEVCWALKRTLYYQIFVEQVLLERKTRKEGAKKKFERPCKIIMLAAWWHYVEVSPAVGSMLALLLKVSQIESQEGQCLWETNRYLLWVSFRIFCSSSSRWKSSQTRCCILSDAQFDLTCSIPGARYRMVSH